MHIGTGGVSSKTECIFFPPLVFFNTQTIPLTSITTSTLSIQKKEIDKKRRTREDEEYVKCNEIEIIKVKVGFATFTNHFKCLGSYISYSLRYDYSIDARIAAGNASIGSLAKLCTDASVDNHSNYLIFLAIPINMILWVCEIWALPTSLLKNLRYFSTAASYAY